MSVEAPERIEQSAPISAPATLEAVEPSPHRIRQVLIAAGAAVGAVVLAAGLAVGGKELIGDDESSKVPEAGSTSVTSTITISPDRPRKR